jgi:hypothetical protein
VLAVAVAHGVQILQDPQAVLVVVEVDPLVKLLAQMQL